MTKTIAYLRTSTNNQGFEKDQGTILHLANEQTLGKVDFVEKTVSLRSSWHERKIGTVLEELSYVDKIIVSELAQLGCSILECMEVISTSANKGIAIYAVNGDWQLDENTKNMKV